jgi:hypothetical protein
VIASDSDSSDAKKIEEGNTKLLLCTVCGLQGSFCCSACASSSHPMRYCSKKHQQVDWKYHKQVCGTSTVIIKTEGEGESMASSTSGDDDDDKDTAVPVAVTVPQQHKRNFTFAEYDITIEEEELSEDDHSDDDDVDTGDALDKDDIAEQLKSSKINPDTIIWEDAGK